MCVSGIQDLRWWKVLEEEEVDLARVSYDEGGFACLGPEVGVSCVMWRTVAEGGRFLGCRCLNGVGLQVVLGCWRA